MKIQLKVLSAALAVAVVATSGYVVWNQQKTVSGPVNSESIKQEIKQTTVLSKQDTAHDLLTIPDNKYPIVENHGIFWRFANVDELYQNAEIVAEIQVLDQETVPVDVGSVSTRSKVAVKQIFKGQSVPSTLTITEVGGVLDQSKLPKMDKPGAGMEPKNAPTIVETALEGSPVMKSGNTYFVFLVQNPNSKWGYNIVGSVQGKLKLDNETKKLANTVDPKKLQEDETFFLQKQFAGKDKGEFERAIKKQE